MTGFYNNKITSLSFLEQQLVVCYNFQTPVMVGLRHGMLLLCAGIWVRWPVAGSVRARLLLGYAQDVVII